MQRQSPALAGTPNALADVTYARNYPFVGYEAPVSESFQKKNGAQPTALAPDDPR